MSGEARFCKATDLFFESLKNESVDWFFYFWKDCINSNVVSPNWRNIISESWAIEQIQKRLPAGHKISNFKLGTPDPTAPISQFYGWTLVDSLRKEYEAVHGEYDLVIKSRPDIYVSGNLNFQEIKDYLNQNPKDILVPENFWWGTDKYRINDCFAISSSKNMTCYSRLHFKIQEHKVSGNLNGQNEELLRYHLDVNGFNTKSWNMQSHLRESGDVSLPPDQYTTDFNGW